jgi:hypothetical protein
LARPWERKWLRPYPHRLSATNGQFQSANRDGAKVWQTTSTTIPIEGLLQVSPNAVPQKVCYNCRTQRVMRRSEAHTNSYKLMAAMKANHERIEALMHVSL